MVLNNDQIKHVAKIFDAFALAALAPIIADYTGIREIVSLTLPKVLIFMAIAFIFEILSVYVLGGTKKEN